MNKFMLSLPKFMLSLPKQKAFWGQELRLQSLKVAKNKNQIK